MISLSGGYGGTESLALSFQSWLVSTPSSSCPNHLQTIGSRLASGARVWPSFHPKDPWLPPAAVSQHQVSAATTSRGMCLFLRVGGLGR